jgi:hypothetical protein
MGAMFPSSERSVPIFWWGIGSAVAMAMGALGPWASVLGISINGTDFSNGGKVVLGLAVLASLCVLGQPQSPVLVVVGLLGGLAALAITIHDRDRVTSLLHNAGPFSSLAKVGWGLNLALAAAVSVVLQALVVAAAELRTEQNVATPLPPKPIARSADGGLNLPHKTAIFKDVQDAERIDAP